MGKTPPHEEHTCPQPLGSGMRSLCSSGHKPSHNGVQRIEVAQRTLTDHSAAELGSGDDQTPGTPPRVRGSRTEP